MRVANHDGRLILLASSVDGQLEGALGTDLHEATGGLVPADPAAAFEKWDDVRQAVSAVEERNDVVIDVAMLRSPSPRPAQIFGIGVNYADHGVEAGMAIPDVPLVFTKLPTAIAGPFDPIPLSTGTVDWEVEVAVVIGRRARRIPPSAAWEHVAGITAGQDLSDREIQFRPTGTPQFGLGKSLPRFGPIGPTLVTPDEFANPDDLELSCRLNGEEVQHARSSQMVRSIPELLAYLSDVTTLLPGDVIFSGTPSGIGMTRSPQRYLEVGDQLETYVERVGTMSHTFVSERSYA